MKYISTRGKTEPILFKDAVLMGLAPDKGLLLPESIPSISDKLESWRTLSYKDLAVEVFSLFISDIPHADIKKLVYKSYESFDCEEVTPLVKCGDLYVQELFHGPTLAFKDIALQFLGNLFEYILNERGGSLNILGATSGDTGSAAIYGVRGKKNINIFIMHPHGKVSEVQEKQMTTVLDSNVFNLAINGTFDDGQSILKEIFADQDFKEKYSLGAVNSVNWARVLGQIVYYIYGSLKITKEESIDRVTYSVPTGNFGDIFAGYMAKKMGAPIEKLIVATNENDILHRFFTTGKYSVADVVATVTPSMDIQVASNFERWCYFYFGKDSVKVENFFDTFKTSGVASAGNEVLPLDSSLTSYACGKEETLKVIKKYWDNNSYVLDPHSAVGVAAGEKVSDATVISLATAHPAKFNDAIVDALGQSEGTHPTVESILTLPTKCENIDAQRDAIKEYMVKNITL